MRTRPLHLPALIGAAKPRPGQGAQDRRRAMLAEMCRLAGGRCLNEITGIEFTRGLVRVTRVYSLLGSPFEVWEEPRWTLRGWQHTFWIQAIAPQPSFLVPPSLIRCLCHPSPAATAPLASPDSSASSTASTTASAPS